MEKIPPVIEEEAFNNAFGRWTEVLAPYSEGSRVGIMVTLMSAFSAYIGPDVRSKSRKGTGPLSVWFVLVGESGESKKGSTADIAMPVIQQAFPAWHAEHCLSALPTTGLGIAAELHEHKKSPVFFLQEELDDFIADAKSDKKIGTRLRVAWDGKTIRHKNSRHDITVERPHMAFVGHVQPENWGAIMGSRDATGGTYNRVLTIHVEQERTVPVYYGPDPDPDIAKVAGEMREVGELVREMGANIPVPPDLAQRFEEHYRPIVEGLTKGNKRLSQLSGRVMAYVIRMAPLFAIADLREEVSEADFESSLALARYSVDSVRYILPDTGGTTIAQTILQAVRDRAHEQKRDSSLPDVSRSDISDRFGRNVPSKEIDKAIAALPQIVSYEAKSGGGRKPTRLRLRQESDVDKEASV